MSDINTFENEITEAVEKVNGSVVTVNNHGYAMGRHGRAFPFNGQGSGIIISSSGYVMTNYHVVKGAQNMEIITSEGNLYQASYIGGDPATDIALLRIKGKNLPYAELGDSDKLRTGQFVVAVGNALGLPGKPSVSLGLVSATGRPMPHADFIAEGLIQTDAAINPGNSGGPLATMNGEVVGINSSMMPFAHGIGFAIPINTAKRIMEQILEHGRVIRPWLGISGVTVRKGTFQAGNVDHGVLIVNVTEGSPAYYAGLMQSDVIVSVNGEEIQGMKTLLENLSRLEIGKKAVLGILRHHSTTDREIDVVEMPEFYLERIAEN